MIINFLCAKDEAICCACVCLHAFSTLALDRGKWLTSLAGCRTVRKRPNTNRAASCVDVRTVPDAQKAIMLCTFRKLNHYTSVVLTVGYSISQIRCPGSTYVVYAIRVCYRHCLLCHCMLVIGPDFAGRDVKGHVFIC